MARVRAVKPHDGEVLVLHPDSPAEAALARVRLGPDVKNKRAHFAQEFAPDEIEIVISRVEAAHVREDHLQKALRHKFSAEIEEMTEACKDAVRGAVIG